MSVGCGLGKGICKGSPGGSTEQHYIENTISNNLSEKGLREWYSWILAFSKMEFCFHTHLFRETRRIYKCIQLFSFLNLNGSLGYTILGHPSCPQLCGHCSNCLLLWMLPWRSQASVNVFPFMCDLIFLLSFPWKSLLWRLATLLDCALVLTALWLFSGSAVKIQIFFLRCFINLYFEIPIAFHLFWLLLWGFQFCICWISIACLTRDNSIYKCLKSKSVFRYKADLSLSGSPTFPKRNVCPSNYIFSHHLLVSIFYLYCTRNPFLLWLLLFSC